MKIITTTMALLLVCTIVSAEKVQWYSGAFPEDGSGKKTTSSNIISKDADTTKYVFGFSTPKSNIAFAQFPLKPQAGKNTLSLSAKSKTGKVNAEVWIESNSGWKFQGKITINPDKFSEIILPLKQCKANEVKYLRIAIPNKNNPKRGMLFFKNPTLCDHKIIKSRVWHTGIFKAKDKSSCEQSPTPEGAVKFSWKFDGIKAGPVFLSTKFKTNEDCKKFELTVKNSTKQATEFEIWVESNSGWKFQGKLNAPSQKWKTQQFELREAKSTETKYIRIIVATKGNPFTGAVYIKNVKYVK